ncbi:hypothetical protein FAUST_7715 [Fusarium austroamericanum]|uniref:DUF7732 domain-containing protein n=1 Tax=Fusarium austroamericanum TaxID=282268 RepID=A0AAN5Z5X2_FUSAU|nr:hypothetical protein FAUST_7715 [Fusarium austroamericanum]
MRPDLAVVLFTLFSSAVASAIDGPLHIKRVDSAPSADEHDLYKRRGGGGGGGRGGSSGGSRGGSSGSRGGSSSSGSRGGSSGGSSRGSSSGSSRPGSGSGSSSGRTPARGPQPSYAGGRYAGGASRPYSSGSNSPSGIKPALIGAGVGGAAALAFWPGLWLGGAYLYHYPNSYRYYNESSEEEEDRPILCACSREASCGCDQDDNVNNTALYDELIGNGSYEHLNKSIVDVAEVNGTTTILINGTLPKDTALPSEGSSSGSGSGDSDSAAARAMIEAMGYWPAAAAVLAAVLVA